MVFDCLSVLISVQGGVIHCNKICLCRNWRNTSTFSLVAFHRFIFQQSLCLHSYLEFVIYTIQVLCNFLYDTMCWLYKDPNIYIFSCISCILVKLIKWRPVAVVSLYPIALLHISPPPKAHSDLSYFSLGQKQMASYCMFLSSSVYVCVYTRRCLNFCIPMRNLCCVILYRPKLVFLIFF